ncbi:MAG: DUF1987 domain-containing protein [Chlorobi bacterium]|nr:DUF1987 domain-containing protein [Chlorobiota bacterium]
MNPEPIIIEPAAKTPEIIFDKKHGVFQIRGRSISENAGEFYQPVKEWMKEYVKDPNPETKLLLNFDYLNSSSLIQISNIIRILEEAYNNGHKVLVIWQYEEGDELIENTGIELNIISKVPFVTEIYEPEDYENFDFDFDA